MAGRKEIRPCRRHWSRGAGPFMRPLYTACSGDPIPFPCNFCRAAVSPYVRPSGMHAGQGGPTRHHQRANCLSHSRNAVAAEHCQVAPLRRQPDRVAPRRRSRGLSARSARGATGSLSPAISANSPGRRAAASGAVGKLIRAMSQGQLMVLCIWNHFSS